MPGMRHFKNQERAPQVDQDAFQRLVERPNLPDTLLSARLQPFWNGAIETVSVVETRLTCE